MRAATAAKPRKKTGGPSLMDGTLDSSRDSPARHTRSRDPVTNPRAGHDGPDPSGGADLGSQALLDADGPAANPVAVASLAFRVARHGGSVGTRPSGAPVRASEQMLAIYLLVGAMLVWMACIGCGTYLHTGPPLNWRKMKNRLPLMWFDYMLRHVGSLLPLPVLCVRAAGNMAGGARQTVREYHHFIEASAVYAGLSLVRVLVYITHRDGWFSWFLSYGLVSAAPMELMSDHVFLAACLASIFSAEAVLLCVDLFRHPHSRPRQVLLTAGFLLCGGLYLLTCGDMFYTTFYFHSRSESLWAAVTGLVTFQLPIGWWLLYGGQVPVTPSTSGPTQRRLVPQES